MNKPSELSASTWASKLAGLVRQGAGPDDERVQAARAALAYWRARNAIGPEVVAALDDVGRDLLISVLRGDVEVPA